MMSCHRNVIIFRVPARIPATLACVSNDANSLTWQAGINWQVPEAHTEALGHPLQVWMVADHQGDLTAQLACLMADQEVVQAVVLLADQYGHALHLFLV